MKSVFRLAARRTICPRGTTNRQRRLEEGPPLPIELPLSRRPVERGGDDYKRLKTAMARRLRGDDE
jgi:hypothetical protein